MCNFFYLCREWCQTVWLPCHQRNQVHHITRSQSDPLWKTRYVVSVDVLFLLGQQICDQCRKSYWITVDFFSFCNIVKEYCWKSFPNLRVRIPKTTEKFFVDIELDCQRNVKNLVWIRYVFVMTPTPATMWKPLIIWYNPCIFWNVVTICFITFNIIVCFPIYSSRRKRRKIFRTPKTTEKWFSE